jgi:hypothetical protein
VIPPITASSSPSASASELGIVLIVLAAVVVVAIALGAVGRTVARLANEPALTVLQLDDAVDYIADRLPEEIASRVSYDDVAAILGWHLEYFDAIGMASRHGEQIGGDVVSDDDEPVIAGGDESVDWVVERAMASGSDLSALDVVVVLDLQLAYLGEIGAVGPMAPNGDVEQSSLVEPARRDDELGDGER